jgi:VWFA-related protein
MRSIPRLALAVTAAALLAVAAAAQTPSAPQEKPAGQFAGDVEVSEVLLDVLVTDKDGRAIIGLQPDDFIVQEDGEPVEITGLTFYSNSRFMEAKTGTPAESLGIDRAPVDRYFILFFHDQRRGTAPIAQTERQQLEAARRAREWVREEVLPTDWVAVASYGSKLVLHQDFTHDKQAILAALEDAPIARDRKGNWPSRIDAAEGEPSLAAALPKGKQLRDETKTIYDGLRVLAEAAGSVVGRKNLLMFSRGFGDLDNFGIYKPDPRYYPPMERALNENNVAVYAIDVMPPEVEHTMSHALNQIADETGGRYYFNFTNFITPLRQIAEENSGYYLLSYRATHPAGESGFQRVRVTTANPELKVKAREGYLYGEG